MAKSFLVSPGRAYLVIAEEGTKIVRTNGTLIDTVPEGANAVSITVDTHEIIVMDNAAKIQQLYNGNSGSSGIMTTAEGEDAGTWKIEIVSSLPAQGSAGVIYMVRTNRTGTDRYDDYIWIPEDNAYELLGRRPESTPVDLSNVAKTNVENTFTQNQKVNGTLTTRDISVMRSLSCEQRADIGTAVVNDLDYYTASGSSMTASHVTILTSLHVAPQAAVTLPGVDWRTDTSGDYIEVTRKPIIDTAEIKDTLKVSNVLTLGTGSIILNGYYRTIGVTNGEASVTIEPSCIHVLSSDADLALKGTSISMHARTGNRTLFSFVRNDDGKFVLNSSDGVILNGAVSMPGTLTVNNLNVTGTVTGITTGGDTPTIDFSNGLTVMQTLTADDVEANTVAASTLSAGSSLSIAAEPVIYRHTDGATYIRGGVVNATRVETLTFFPKNIQGATFIGPLVMTKDNALRVWRSGSTAEISNGDITGFHYAQFEQCSIAGSLTIDEGKARNLSVVGALTVKDLVVTGTATGIPRLTMDEGTARSASITDTLVVKDLIVTGTTTGIQGSGGGTSSGVTNLVEGDLRVNGDLWVEGDVTAMNVLASRVEIQGDGEFWTGGTVTAMSVLASSLGITDTTNGRNWRALFNYSMTNNSRVVTLADRDGYTLHFDTDSIHAQSVSADAIEVGAINMSSVDITLATADNRTHIEPGFITLLQKGTSNEEMGVILTARSYSAGRAGSMVSRCSVLLCGEQYLDSPIVALQVPYLQIGPTAVSLAYAEPYLDGPTSCMLSLYSSDLSSMGCLYYAPDATNMLELRSYNKNFSLRAWEAKDTALRVQNLQTDRIARATGSSSDPISVMSPLRIAGGLTVVNSLTADYDFKIGNQLFVSASGEARVKSLSVVDALRVGTVDAKALLDWLAANKDALTNLISSASA